MPSVLSSIIYVDDNPEDRKFFRDHVAPALDNEVDYLSRGEELLQRLEENTRMQRRQPGILLIDLTLPGISGYALVQTIRQDHRYMDLTPMIIVSGTWDETSIQTAKAVGADWYLGKPVTVFGIIDALRHCTHKYRFGIFEEVPAHADGSASTRRHTSA